MGNLQRMPIDKEIFMISFADDCVKNCKYFRRKSRKRFQNPI